jgi:S-adenosylmethionine-dependent methyltransferase
MTTSDSFDKKLDAFKEHQDTPWSRLRYNITAANLKRHTGTQPLNILDAGGGNGFETIAFARQGHKVALVDYSSEMLSEARKNAEDNQVAENIQFYQGDLTSITQLFPPREFDLALCHHVLQYVDDLDAALQAIIRAVKPRGLISIICINRYSESYRLALQELDLPAAYSALNARVIISKVFDAPMKAYAAEDMRIPLKKAGCAILGQYGIRCVNDYIPNNEIKNDPAFFADMEKLELAMSNKFPYYLMARSFHIVAQKIG